MSWEAVRFGFNWNGAFNNGVSWWIGTRYSFGNQSVEHMPCEGLIVPCRGSACCWGCAVGWLGSHVGSLGVLSIRYFAKIRSFAKISTHYASPGGGTEQLVVSPTGIPKTGPASSTGWKLPRRNEGRDQKCRYFRINHTAKIQQKYNKVASKH
jgi:hypothetical protein